MRIIILLLGLFVFSQTSRSQDLYIRYLGDSSRSNAVKSIIPLIDGFILAGNFFYESDTSDFPYDIYCLKINLEGDILWSKIFRGEKNERMGSIKPIDSTGYIFLGESSFGSGNYDNLIMRLNNVGDTIWVKIYGGPKSDFNGQNNNLEVLPDGSFIISSMTWSVGQGASDAHIVRFSKDGVPIWARTIGGSSSEKILDGGMIRVDSSIYVSGQTQSPEFNAVGIDGMVIKMNLNGDTLWSKRYADWGIDYFDNISKADGNNFLLVGQTLSTPTPGKFDGFIVKINSDGDTLWIRGLTTPGHTYLYHSFTTIHGHYIVGRAVGFINEDVYAGFISKVSLNGDLLWTRYISDDPGSSIEKLHIDSLGNLFLFGYTGIDNNTGFFIKTDTTSSLGQCNFKDAFPTLRSTTTQVFDMHPMVIDTILPISSVTLKVGSGFSVKNYCSGIGFEELSDEKQINLFPNPFSTQLNFNFPEITNQKITVEIIEIATGRIILQEKVNSSNGVLSINDIASGIYLARISNGREVLYKGKLVCIKE